MANLTHPRREEFAGVVRRPGFAPVLARPVLGELLDGASHHPLCVVTAAAGWGKTTAVRQWAQRRNSAWCSAADNADPSRFARLIVRTLAGLEPNGAGRVSAASLSGDRDLSAALRSACAALDESLRDDAVLVLDDLGDAGAAARLLDVVQAVARYAPPLLHLVLISRRELPFRIVRPRGRGRVAEITAPDLAFTRDEIGTLLCAGIGMDLPDLVDPVRARTGGWPSAVVAAVELLRVVEPSARVRALGGLSRPGGRFHTYLAQEVLEPEPEPVRTMLRTLGVCGITGLAADDRSGPLVDLARRGLAHDTDGDRSSSVLVPPLADYVAHDPALTSGDRVLLHTSAAWECAARGDVASAMRQLVAGGARESAASLVAEHGLSLVRSGRADVVLDIGRALRGLDDPRVRVVLSHAMRARGLWPDAADCLRATENGEPDGRSVWPQAALALDRGELGEALTACGAVPGPTSGTIDEVQVLVLAANARCLTGDLDGAAGALSAAEQAATVSEDSSAWAAVHHGYALVAAGRGDRREAEGRWATALVRAEAATDVLLAIWIRCCRAELALDLGSPVAASADIDTAELSGDVESCPFLVAYVATLRARARARLGRLGEARDAADRAIDLFRDLGSRFVARPLCVSGDLHALRGGLAQARAAYEEARSLAEPVGDRRGVADALAGLARVRAADAPDLAAELADSAVAAVGSGGPRVRTVLTRGWVGLCGGRRDVAARDASTAEEVARQRRDVPGVAEAITLGALSVGEVDETPGQAHRLQEAVEMFRIAGCRIDEAAAGLVAAHLTAARPDHAGRVRLSQRVLREQGVTDGPAASAGPLAVVAARATPALSIQALGPFRVERSGIPVPHTSWRSKKARTLLKILVARRRPVPREQLVELLWPDADPLRSGNRLSVLLSMLRDVVVGPAGDAIATDGGTVGLNRSIVRIDVENYLAAAGAALATAGRGEGNATELLLDATERHTGDFLEEDPYADWAVPLAEEVRATHAAVLRALTGALRQAGDVDGVVRYALRLLAYDPYDDMAHRAVIEVLLDAGRLGEARRHHRRYRQRMAEIGVPPHPVPGLDDDEPPLRLQPRIGRAPRAGREPRA